MTDRASFDQSRLRSNWVRLRTLIILRWFAIAGQLAAITIAQRLFELNLNLGLCFMAIGAAIITNLIAVFIFPENKRLTEFQVAGMLVFDLVQLSFLLFLTGGLNNPFAILVLVPVTISATTLSARTTATIGTLAIGLISAMALWHVPLRTDMGFIMRMPQDFVWGFWIAITIGVIFLGLYAGWIAREMHAMSDALAATQMALAREQKLTDLGGVVAAAAHELGTPLATIKLVSAELIEELEDRPDLLEDARLIREQADRCRDILRSMGQAGKSDRHIRQAPVAAVVREAAEPHEARGKEILYDVAPLPGANPEQPIIDRQPEIIHGLRNLVQNAVDFSQSSVWVDVFWDDKSVSVRIVDDGPGFSSAIIGRIGDPFVKRKRTGRRPGYEGMGLGLFIAKTLLERSGAEITFTNGREPYEALAQPGERTGAIVQARWSRERIGRESEARAALGENIPLAPSPIT